MSFYIKESIDNYVGKCCTPEIDYLLRDDGNGVYVSQWNVTSIAEPTMEQLTTISDNLSSAIELQEQKVILLAQNQNNYNIRRYGIKTINGVNINIDPVSSVNISGQILGIMFNRMSNGNPTTITWFDDDNMGHQYTEDEFITIGQTVAYTIFLIQQKLSNNIISINAATTLGGLNSISIDYSNF